MLAFYVFPLLSIASLALSSDAQQIPIDLHGPDADNTAISKRVAIIGAGIAGASATYLLRERYKSRLAIDITVYEAASQVGGRVNLSRFMMGLIGHSMSRSGRLHSILITHVCRLQLTRLA